MTDLNVLDILRSEKSTPLKYDAQQLLGVVIARLEEEGVLPAGTVPPDPGRAYRCCRELLRALGVEPTQPLPPVELAAAA